MNKSFLLLIIFFLSFSFQNFSQEKDDLISSATLNGLKFRSIGPAFMSGRIVDFAVNPDNYHEFYVAVACGGVWKTQNSGISWTPVFDNQGSYSIGCVAIDPSNTHTVWVGSGENNSQRSVAWGDGVYKSTDDGKTWKNMGLKKSEHIGKIVIHPTNSNIVYVAAQGPLWGPGGDRGLYKTTDGGETWMKVLEISENTGVNEVVMDPANPDILIASSYQRRRHVWTLINGGPESAIYKSTDGGKNWNKITNGIPNVDLGRIGLAMSPVDPDIVFAIIEAADDKGGLFKSIDKGESWSKVNNYSTVSAQYYNELVCDPKNADKLFILDTRTKYSIDGGKTVINLGGKHRHVDDHAIWINPEFTDHLLIGGDGGIYESFDMGDNWQFKANLPVTQFYRVTADNSEPFYYVYGGTQDNNSQGGPSRTTNTTGITNEDWFVTKGGDGFETVIDPLEPNIVYSQSQYGWLVRYDKKTGESIGIKPMEKKGEEAYHWNWDAPLIISPHDNKRLYFGANYLFRSDDRGNSWKKVSPDLTKKIDRNQLKVMDKIWSVDAVAKNASTSIYGNIVSIDESPLVEGLLYTGSDDGQVSVSEDGGTNWKKAKLPDIPEYAYVSDIMASQHDANTVYVTFSNHKMADFNPYILKSTDRGKSWKSISSNLKEPEVVWTIAEDHIDKNLLFIGTEYGVYVSINGGEKWMKLKSGLPTIAVRDIDIQKRENDLVLGTFGRSFYILDDYSPLRNLTKENLQQEAYIFPIKDALMYVQTSKFAYGEKGSQGESFYTTPNPPYGATFTYYLKESIKTKKQIRKDLEKKQIEKGEEVYYPNFEELREEDLEQTPFLVFEIKDETGKVVRRLKAPATSGVQRITWDLKYSSQNPVNRNSKNENEGAFMALPGKYTLTLYKNESDILAKIAGPIEFTCKTLGDHTLPEKDRTDFVAFTKKVSELRAAYSVTNKISKELENNILLIKDAIRLSEGDQNKLLITAREIERENQKIQLALNGNKSIESRNESVAPSINSRLDALVYEIYASTQAPTKTQNDNYKIISDELAAAVTKLKQLVEKDLKELEAELDKANAPYTPGRMPVWK